MQQPCLTGSWPAALLAVVSVVATARAAPADVPPAPPAPPALPALPAVHPGDGTDLDAQLEAARKRLEQAAHEVARLSERISGRVIEQVMPLAEPHAIIGVQLDPAGAAGGARVREVSPGGPAAEAGIRSGDVIVTVNGTELASKEPARQVVRILRNVKPDGKVSVRVLREGKTHDYLVTARPSPGFPDIETWPALPEVFMIHGPLMDTELATLTPRLGSYFGSDKGVLVVRAPSDGALKLEDGDVILAIDGREPTSGSHATRILGSYQPGEKVSLRILRQHKTLQLEAAVPENSGAMREDKDAIFFDNGALHLEGLLHEGRALPRQQARRGADAT